MGEKKERTKREAKERERHMRFITRHKALSIVNNPDLSPAQIDKNINDYLFGIGLKIVRGDVSAMWDAFLRYKEVCAVTEEPMLPATLAMVMGLSLPEVQAIMAKKLYADNQEIQDLVHMTYSYAMAEAERAYTARKIEKAILIWYQKNLGGMSDYPDRPQVDKSEDSGMSPSEIADKYKDILD